MQLSWPLLLAARACSASGPVAMRAALPVPSADVAMVEGAGSVELLLLAEKALPTLSRDDRTVPAVPHATMHAGLNSANVDAPAFRKTSVTQASLTYRWKRCQRGSTCCKRRSACCGRLLSRDSSPRGEVPQGDGETESWAQMGLMLGP